MRKFLLLFIATICSTSIWAAEWKQCKNCGKHFQGDSAIGYDYCRKNSCQSVRQKEESAQARNDLQAELSYLNNLKNKWSIIESVGKYCTKAQKQKISVNDQLKAISAIYKKLNYSVYLWQQVICYASMDVVKACWPSADNEDVLKKSTQAENSLRPFLIGPAFLDYVHVPKNDFEAFSVLPLQGKAYGPDLNKQSNKYIGCAFALGKHQKTGETRYVEKLNANSFQYLAWAAEAGRTDVLEYFLKQMGGVDITALCILTGCFTAEVNSYDSKRNNLEKEIKNLETKKNNAPDKYQEKEFAKKIAAAKKQIAEIPSMPVGKYEAVKKLIVKYTDDKVFNEFILLVSNSRGVQKKVLFDFMKAKPRGKKCIEYYEKTGSFIWKPGLPNKKQIGVLSGTKEDTWVAAPGFVMQKNGTAKWQAGLKHPKYENIVSTEQMFYWLPLKEYYWCDKNPNSLKASKAADIVGNAVLKNLENNSNRRRY